MDGCRQIIVKAGTRLLTDRGRISSLTSGIALLRDRGFRVLLVSSGAVGTGMRLLKMTRRPRELSRIQALAAVGQCRLMAVYEEECRRRGFRSAQLLLTAADLRSRERYLNVMNCINALWEQDVLPIVNENDSVSVDELKFGDNDVLSGVLATLTGSQLTVILTTEQGLRVKKDGILGERISVVSRIDARVRSMAGGTDDSDLSIGGMRSKIRAAEMVTAAGGSLWIASGLEDGILGKIVRAEDVGTLFVPGSSRVSGHKRWLKFFACSSGSLIVDQGAVRAVRDAGGSLLPSGVLEVRGVFRRGDAVDVLDQNGDAVARGLVNYSSAECAVIRGMHSPDLIRVLGRAADDEVIHRDNLSLV